MHIVEIHERTVPLSRFADPALPSGGLTTSVVAVTVETAPGRRVTGYGFGSFGRYGQAGLIAERFAPRLRAASAAALTGADGALDPAAAWAAMMHGEKPGGHGERCVAVGTLDTALWDAAAKAADRPLWAHLAAWARRPSGDPPRVPVYAGGGYRYPADDRRRLAEEMKRFRDLGFVRAKMKVGGAPLADDLARVETAQGAIGDPGSVAVDAMNAYGPDDAREAATALAALGPWWIEDICDPLDFDTLAVVAGRSPVPIAAGEALFSLAEARLLARHGGLDPSRDVLLFDPVHCYGPTHYAAIVGAMEASGWPRRAFWPHGGHLVSLHVAAALGLGGSEINPTSFAPFGGLGDRVAIADGRAAPPDAPGFGFETGAALAAALRSMLPA